jgi:hypothetical protein
VIILSSTTDKVEVVTSGTADIEYASNYVVGDKTASPMVVKDADNKQGAISSAATTDVTGSPAGANDRWNVTHLSFRNKHASASNDLTVRQVDGGTSRELIKVTLLAGEALVRNKDGVWFVYNTDGSVKASSPAATTSLAGVVQLADQATMETATDNTKAVTPGNQHFHPAEPKFWARVTVSGGTPTLSTSYNVTSITDTATGRLTITIANDFSSANWCCQVSVEAASNATAVANRRIPCVANAGMAAGTVEVNCWDATATNSNLVDPATWFVMGQGDL